jgi:predicted dinucleotide-binding enzyme
MKIGMIGAGMIGRAVATLATRAGDEVMLSNSRRPETLFSLKNTLGCATGTASQAAAFGEMVLVAIPLYAWKNLPRDALAGKIVLDAMNFYADRDGSLEDIGLHADQPTSVQIARAFPDARLVKVFGAITAGNLETAGRPAGARDRIAIPVASDDEQAKTRVAALLDRLGFDAVDAGDLGESWRFEPGTPAYCIPLNIVGVRSALARA